MQVRLWRHLEIEAKTNVQLWSTPAPAFPDVANLLGSGGFNKIWILNSVFSDGLPYL